MRSIKPGSFISILIASNLCCGIASAQSPGSVNPDAPQLRMDMSMPPPAEANVAPLANAARPIAIEGDALFPRYPSLQPAVTFWTQVFGKYSEYQSLVHSADYPHKIFTVLDFRGDKVSLNAVQLANKRKAEETRAKEQVVALLERVHERRERPETLSLEERKIYDLYADIADADKFERAAKSVRSQRGLAERTQAALEISGKYLPEMERIFSGYQLPVRLTRLPLVESSFNVEAYSKVGAAGLWQFMPSSAKIYMRLNDLVDDRRDPWTSTDAAARHLRDDYRALGSWPLALTAYNHGRGGVARGLKATGGTTLPDLIRDYKAKSFGFASRNFYAEFLAASDVEREYKKHFGEVQRRTPLAFEIVETKHYVPYETLRQLCGADDELFRKLNPAYRPEVMEGKLYVPPGHLIRVPAGSAKSFDVAYARLGEGQRFSTQRVSYLLHKVKRGETLSGVAKRYGVSMSSISAANGLGKKGMLRVGQVLKVTPHTESRPGPITVAVGESKPAQTREQKLAENKPSKSRSSKAKASSAAPKYRIHKVSSGQTLSGIARRYDVSVSELRRANGLQKTHIIKPGMKLKVPNNS